MIKETTYCKRNTSIFAKQIKKNKEKMKADIQNTDKVSSFQQEGKKKTKSNPTKRQLIPSSNYKQSVRDTFTEDKNVGGDLYTMAEIILKKDIGVKINLTVLFLLHWLHIWAIKGLNLFISKLMQRIMSYILQ